MAAITTMSGAQFDALPYEEGRKWELVSGEMVSMPSPTWQHQDIVFKVLLAIRTYLETNGGGLASQDVEFALSDDDRLRPDVAVLMGENARRLDPAKTPIPGAPDIAIEVISPSERASESRDKVLAYLRAGAVEVWQVYPKSRTVLLHRGHTARSLDWIEPIETNLLPGFALQLSSLFA